MELRTGTVLDGEAAIGRDGRFHSAAAQSRAAPSVPRARALAARYPASYICWDVPQDGHRALRGGADGVTTAMEVDLLWQMLDRIRG
ncbi:hypothetical protein PUR34_05125 [Streptomyces sp. JV185]|uniref:hypothetical protein n=1 Tax=Streptomyces sp. JV185 TaxID=858638 RepID=UPI002E76D4B2|nr:hypothetical protein [Streptomyces sp. JV185]MEE1767577.1 hypothetical protein [Streptomyces sp. JV185]